MRQRGQNRSVARRLVFSTDPLTLFLLCSSFRVVGRGRRRRTRRGRERRVCVCVCVYDYKPTTGGAFARRRRDRGSVS